MYIFNIPGWINSELLSVGKLDDVPESVFEDIKQQLQTKTSKSPDITVLIAAWNEELNIVRCLQSLLSNVTDVTYDIIVVNNNSTDRTQEVLDRLGVQSYFERKQGCGPARNLGQGKSTAKYILLADADSIYPKQWIKEMHRVLKKDGVVGVYGKYSFLNTFSGRPRWKYAIYEFFQGIIVWIRSMKRPYLNAYGISMGYVRELGVKVGYLERNIRGDDGRLIFDLMKFGKIKLVSSAKSRVWTTDRTLLQDGGIFNSFKKRFLREIARFDKYYTKPEDHETRVSENEDYSVEESMKIIKDRFKFFKKK